MVMFSGKFITNPLLRTRALILFEALRLLLVLAIIGWWGWMLIDKTHYIISLEGELAMRDATYIPLYDGARTLRMVIGEAVTLTLLVLVSALVSFWLCIRDIRRNRSLQAFFAAMAHELRTPLASIRLQAEGLAALGSSPYLLRLQNDVLRLEAQLERGLELARSESGKALACNPVNLAECVERSLNLIPQPMREQIVLQCDLSGTVMADAHAIQVILRNLFENALLHGKATQIKLYQHPSSASNTVTLICSDNGQGFAGNPRQLGKLFFRGATSRGTGVGLYLIQALMKQMGGKAEFGGENGFKATLTFQGAP